LLSHSLIIFLLYQLIDNGFSDYKIPDLLKETILPEIIKKKSITKRIRIWSAGCSTGEEPYSIAILLKELIITLNSWDISILAADIDQKALDEAVRGVFREWSFRGVDENIKKNCYCRSIRKDI